MQEPSLNPPARLPGLDVLRALAIVLVLFAHGPAVAEGELHWTLDVFFSALKRGGWVGVDLFFVLSGFLVSGLLLREHRKHGSIRPLRFLIRRGWKLYPPMAVFLLFVTIQTHHQRGYWPTDRLLSNLLWVQNYRAGLQIHTWSLAVEEHAYLLLAAVFGLAAWRAGRAQWSLRLRWVPWVFLPIALAGLLMRILAARSSPFDPYLHQFPTHLRIDSLLAGVVLAYFYHEYNGVLGRIITRYRRHLLGAAVLLLIPPFLLDMHHTPWVYTYGLTTNYLGALCLLGACLGMTPRPGRLTHGVTAIGRHSYSIYLWHMTAYQLTLGLITGQYTGRPTWDAPFALHLALFLSVTIGAGVVLSILIEVPMLRLRDKLSPPRSGALAPLGIGEQPQAPTGTARVIPGASA